MLDWFKTLTEKDFPFIRDVGLSLIRVKLEAGGIRASSYQIKFITFISTHLFLWCMLYQQHSKFSNVCMQGLCTCRHRNYFDHMGVCKKVTSSTLQPHALSSRVHMHSSCPSIRHFIPKLHQIFLNLASSCSQGCNVWFRYNKSNSTIFFFLIRRWDLEYYWNLRLLSFFGQEERVYKLPFASTPERRWTILTYENKSSSRSLREVDSP